MRDDDETDDWPVEDAESSDEESANEENSTDECPHCGAAVYDDAEQCPACGMYLSRADAPSRLPPLWILIGVGVCLVIVILWALSGF